MSDSTSQLISIIKNGYLAKKKEVFLPHSGYKEDILRVLEKGNYLEKIIVTGKKPKLVLQCVLKYEKGEPGLRQIKMISKPGLRVYQKAKGSKKVLGGLGIKVISTPKGVMTDRQANKENLGGEVVLEVY